MNEDGGDLDSSVGEDLDVVLWVNDDSGLIINPEGLGIVLGFRPNLVDAWKAGPRTVDTLHKS